MAISKIQYDNKVAINIDSTIPDINKCNASDLNEIKSVVNNNADEIPTMSDEYGTSTTDGYSQDYINNNTISPSGEPSTSEEDVSSATFTNTLEAPMEIDLKGNTSQDGTPTPSSPIPVNVVSGDNEVQVCGKNFFNIQTLVKGRLDNGVIGYASNTTDLTLNENSFSFTTNANYRGVTSDYIKVNGTEYLCSCTTPSTLNIIVACYDSNKNYLRDSGLTYITGHNNQAKITLQNDVAFIRIYFYLSQAGTITIENPQLEKGFIPTTYEAYNGTTYNIDLPVENLLSLPNSQEISGITFTKNDDGTFNLSGTASENVEFYSYLSLNESKISNNTYTFNTNALGYTFQLTLWNDSSWLSTPINRQQVSTSYNSTTNLTIPSNCNKVGFRIALSSGTTINLTNVKAQLELGTSYNTYTPYGTTPIELNKIGTYQDYFYKENNTWYLHKEIGKVVLDGTEEWNLLQTQTNTLRFSDNNILTNGLATDNIKIIDDMFEVSTTTYDNGDYEHIRSASTDYPNAIVLLINKSRLSTYDRAGLNSWLNTHNVNIYYQVQTPTNTEITYTPLINQLDNLQNAMSKEGTTNVNQVNNDLPFILDLSVFNDTYNGRYEGLKEQVDNNTNDISELQEANNYSTEEQVIGKWIDGKPLYRKVVNIGSISGTTNSYNLGLSNAKVIKYDFNYLNTGQDLMSDFYVDSSLNLRTFLRNNSTLEVREAGSLIITEAKVILEYTKTTD